MCQGIYNLRFTRKNGDYKPELRCFAIDIHLRAIIVRSQEKVILLMNKPVSFILKLVYAVTIVLSGADHVMSQSANTGTNTELSALLNRIWVGEDGWDERLKWDANKNLITVKLSATNSTDSNLFLISSIRSVQSLYLQTHYHAKGITTEGLASLEKMTNLDELHVACSFEMPPGMFKEISKFNQLRKLFLVGAFPPLNEYTNFAALTNLEKLDVTYGYNFDASELTAITNLKKLKDLRVIVYDTNHNSNVLSGLTNLTNLTIRFAPPIEHNDTN